MRWIDYGSLRGGLSLFSRQWGFQPPMVMMLHLWETNKKLRMVFPQAVTIAAGKQWQSGEYWLTPHAAGWAKGIEPYRAWVRPEHQAGGAPAGACPPRAGLPHRLAFPLLSRRPARCQLDLRRPSQAGQGSQRTRAGRNGRVGTAGGIPLAAAAVLQAPRRRRGVCPGRGRVQKTRRERGRLSSASSMPKRRPPPGTA